MSIDSPNLPGKSTTSPPSGFGRELVSGAIGGALAGLAALLLDHLLAYLVTGVPLPTSSLDIWIAYFLVGSVAGIVVTGGSLVAAGRAGLVTSFATAFAVIYCIPIAERLLAFGGGRIERALLAGFSWQRIALLGASILGALLLMGIAGLWLTRRSGSGAVGRALTGLAAATGLAVNRGAFQHPLEIMALVADVLIVLSVMAAAELYRWAGTKALVAVMATGLAIAFIRVAQPMPETLESEAVPSKPHLILLVVDTLQADVFERVVRETPEGRAFAEHFDDAAWFSRAQATSPWTAPSMGSIRTESVLGRIETGQDRALGRLRPWARS